MSSTARAAGIVILASALAFAPRTVGAQRRAKLLIGDLTLATQSFRLLSKIPNEAATEFRGHALGVGGSLFVPENRLGVEFSAARATKAMDGAGRYAAFSLVGLFGQPDRAVEFGIGRRRGFNDRSDRDLDQMHSFVKVGGRYAVPLGSMGFQVGARGSLYLPVSGGSGEGAGGLEAGTELRWTSERDPLTIALGFRSERFAVQRRAQSELSVVTASVGWTFRRGP